MKRNVTTSAVGFVLVFFVDEARSVIRIVPGQKKIQLLYIHSHSKTKSYLESYATLCNLKLHRRAELNPWLGTRANSRKRASINLCFRDD